VGSTCQRQFLGPHTLSPPLYPVGLVCRCRLPSPARLHSLSVLRARPVSAMSRSLRAPVVTPRPIPGPAALTPGSSLGSYIVPTDQHKSFVRTLSSLMRTRENFPVGHPSQIAPSQARLTWRFFRDMLPKKKMHLVGMVTLLILLSLGPGHPIPGARISQSTPLRRPTSSSVNPNPGTSPLSHVYVSSVVICHAM
jgi:hypothetical protein